VFKMINALGLKLTVSAEHWINTLVFSHN
jgi:hypothetical protein